MNHRRGFPLSGFVVLSTAFAVPALIQGAACTGTVAVATEIGPAGGTVEGPNGVQAIIPAGALARTTTITIRTVPPASAPALSNGLAYTGDVYSFEPHGLAFDAPVRVRLPLGTGVSSEAVLHASCAANSAGAAACSPWDAPLDGVTFQPGFAVLSTQGFSLYAAAAQEGSGGAGGGASTSTGSTGGSGGAGGASTSSTGTGAGGCQACAPNEECDGTDHCVEVLASGLGDPVAIAVDATNVYWASNDGTVMECAVGGCGGAPTTLATGQVSPMVMALDGTHVYWANHGVNGVDGSVMRCAIGGCGGTPEPLATGVFTNAIAVANAELYFTEITPMGSLGAGLIMSCPAGGCSGAPVQLATVDGVPFGLAVNGTTLTWGADAPSTMQTPTVMTCSSSGCTPAALASGSPLGVRQLAMDAMNVYWTNSDFSVMKCPLTGCPNLTPITLASLGGGADIPAAIASDGVNVYFTVIAMGGTPSVMKCAVGGCNGQPTTLAAGAKIVQPSGIAVDGTHVYWTDEAGTVMRAVK